MSKPRPLRIRQPAPPEAALRSSHPAWGLVLLLVSAAGLVGLFSGYNTVEGTVTLPLLGTTIRLGESEGEHENDKD